ncbi:MAG TPA: hypothetical protein VFQ42_22460 [Mycobacterium sp.]|nr:hypothetical protein [Mycobacterium sp.]
MTRYITVRLTIAQAEAASNACDLIRDSYDADRNKREAAQRRRSTLRSSSQPPRTDHAT